MSIEHKNENRTASRGDRRAKELSTAKEAKGSTGNDSYIRTLFGIAALVIIGALLTVVFAIVSGVLNFDQNRVTTIEEFVVASSIAYADFEQTAGAFSQLAIAQIDNGMYLQAEETIQAAFDLESPDEERNQAPLFASAILAERLGQRDVAIERYEEVMSKLRYDFERVYASDMEPNWAQAWGLHENYFDSAIALAFLYRDRGDYEKQIEMLTVGIEGRPTIADLFIFRGWARLGQGDNEGAIEDFNEALRFLPGDEEALAGLEEAGGSVND